MERLHNFGVQGFTVRWLEHLDVELFRSPAVVPQTLVLGCSYSTASVKMCMKPFCMPQLGEDWGDHERHWFRFLLLVMRPSREMVETSRPELKTQKPKQLHPEARSPKEACFYE